MYYGGFLWSEIQTLPVIYKKWFTERIVKEIEKSNDGDGSGTQSRAAHHNAPDARALQNRAHESPPARLRRFT